jgi:hypothetical protein
MTTSYRFDEDFDYFLEKFGDPHDSVPIPEAVIEAYRDKLPEQLFIYWRALGACGFKDGLLWIVNPDEYQDVLKRWLKGTPFEYRSDLSVIVRDAFGHLYVWAKGKGLILYISPSVNLLSYRNETDSNDLDLAQENKKMRYFFGGTGAEDGDQADQNEKLLFARALKNLGPVKSDEMYGYSHRLALGGKNLLSNLEIMKLGVHHDIAQQMEPVQIIDIG